MTSIVIRYPRAGETGSVINGQKRRHLQAFPVEDLPFLDVLADDADAFAGILLVDVTTHVNIERIRALKRIHHLARPRQGPIPRAGAFVPVVQPASNKSGI